MDEKGLCTDEMGIFPPGRCKPEKSQGKGKQKHSRKEDLVEGSYEARAT